MFLFPVRRLRRSSPCRGPGSWRLPSSAHRPSRAPASRRPRAPQPLRLRASPVPSSRAARARPRSRFQRIRRRCPADAPPPPSQTRRGQRRPMAAMGPATARGSRKKPQISAPTLSPPLSQQEFRSFFIRSEQVRGVW